MIDPLAILDGLLADLGRDGSPSVPTFPTTVPTRDDAQNIDKQHFSHTSHISHTGNVPSEKHECDQPSETDFSSATRARARFYVENVGNVGSVGNEATTPAASVTYDFPHPSLFVGNKEEKWEISAQSASPQRSDWWTGPAMADADRLAPRPGDPLPISAADVRAGVARELRALAEDGREGPDALRDAVEITRAKIRNSEALAERQAHGGRCHVCDGPLDDTEPVISILTGKRGAHLHLHADCHDAYRVRRVALVDWIMRAAGYGAEVKGEAA